MNPPLDGESQPFDLALHSDVGTSRSNNEDSRGHFAESGDVIFVVAIGIDGCEGGEVAGAMAVDIACARIAKILSREARPNDCIAPCKEANIQLHNRGWRRFGA